MEILAGLGVIAGLANLLERYVPVVDRTTVEYVLNLYDSDRPAFAQEMDGLGKDLADTVATSIETWRSDFKHNKLQTPEPKEPPGEPRGRQAHRDTLEAGQEFRVRVKSIKKFGAFCELLGVFPKTDGLLHISELSNGRVEKVDDMLQVNDVVTATIKGIENSRVSLTMREPRLKPTKQRLTSPERFEIRQLISAGIYDPKDYPDLDAPDTEIEAQENVDVEVNPDLPKFLSTRRPSAAEVPLEQPGYLRVPDGTLAKSITESTEKLAEKRDKTRKFRLPPPTRSKLQRQDTRAIKTERENLPVFKFRHQLLDAVAQNQIIIVQGDTGSGKTTQIAQYLYESGYATSKSIACTQPRRVAAVSIAERVAQEMGTKVGDLVGYSIRFESEVGPNTRIKYMTDGMFLREVVVDPEVQDYSVLILDEAHERTLSTDILFPLVKKACTHRPDLKIIITSATIDAKEFSEFFNGCPVYRVPGRTFPVEIQYSEQPEFDYIEAALFTTMQIHMTQEKGDVLVFLTGQDEIEACCEQLASRVKDLEGIMQQRVLVLPIYASLPSEAQSRIFDPAPPDTRKIIFATNIAETSITIDGIRYVVDTGMVKVNVYDSQLSMDILKVVPISKAQANQRAGRAGRTSPGKCYRLYTREAYENEMLTTAIPEIQRQQLTSTILLLKAMGINDIWDFDFMNKPSNLAIFNALKELYLLGAINDSDTVTPAGRVMSKFPVDPSMARVLLQSVQKHCSHEMLTILAMLSLPNIFVHSVSERDKKDAERKRRKFRDESGDHLTLLNIYDAWAQSGYSQVWCSEHYIHMRSMRRAQHVRQQLMSILQSLKLRVMSCQRQKEVILQVLCCGYFRNIAKLAGEVYKTFASDTMVNIHPSSVLFGKKPTYVIYHSLLMTSKEYMSCVSIVRPAWLLEYAPEYFQAKSEQSKRKRQEKIAPMLKRHENEEEWRISAQHKFVRYESTHF